MPVQEQFYLTCSGCGGLFVAPDGTQIGETPEEIRDEAVDNDWLCYQGGSETNDYCPGCIPENEADR